MTQLLLLSVSESKGRGRLPARPGRNNFETESNWQNFELTSVRLEICLLKSCLIVYRTKAKDLRRAGFFRVLRPGQEFRAGF